MLVDTSLTAGRHYIGVQLQAAAALCQATWQPPPDYVLFLP